jgi:hypothetical protein
MAVVTLADLNHARHGGAKGMARFLSPLKTTNALPREQITHLIIRPCLTYRLFVPLRRLHNVPGIDSAVHDNTFLLRSYKAAAVANGVETQGARRNPMSLVVSGVEFIRLHAPPTQRNEKKS